MKLRSFLQLAVCVLICSGCSSLETRAVDVVELAEDAILTMSPSSSYPVSSFASARDRTYFGYYTRKNTVEIRYFDNRRMKVSPPTVLWSDWGYNSSGSALGDDHASPSIIVLRRQHGDRAEQNGKLIVAAAEHGSLIHGRGRLQVRRSVYKESIAAWGAPVIIRDTAATYARLVELSDGTLFLFCRLSRNATNSRATFFYWTSDDAGETWSREKLLVDADKGIDDSMYIALSPSPSGSEIEIAVNRLDYDDPVAGVWRYRDIYYLHYDLPSGKWSKADGSVVGDPPFTLSELDLVHESESVTGTEDWTYIVDIKWSPAGPQILSSTDHARGSQIGQKQSGNASLDFHSYSSGHWSAERVGTMPRFNYVNMASLFPSGKPTILGFVSVGDGGSLPCIYERDLDGWRIVSVLGEPVAGIHHARPFVSDLPGAGLLAVWCRITYYEGSPYTEWRSSIVGAVR